MIATVKKPADALRRTFDPDGIHIAQFNGGNTGQSVLHLHVHVVTRWKDKPLGILKYYETGAMADPADMAKTRRTDTGQFLIIMESPNA